MHEDGSPAPIVVTRVAVRRRGDVEAPTEAWIRERIDLLRRVGWPALRRAGSGIAWVLVVDPDRRELVRELVADLVLEDGSVHLADGVGFVPTTAELHLDTVVHPGAGAFVTFRVDSDDALLPGVVAAVIDVAATAVDGTLVDLPHGYQLDLDSGRLVEVHERPWRQGPFLALVHRSRATMLDTGGEHPSAREGRAVLRVPAPAWLQTIHGANLANRMRTATPVHRAGAAVRRLPRRDARAAWVDGRPVAADVADHLLASAGIVLD